MPKPKSTLRSYAVIVRINLELEHTVTAASLSEAVGIAQALKVSDVLDTPTLNDCSIAVSSLWDTSLPPVEL